MVSHQPGLLSARSSSAGLSLVELLVATLVTLIGLLIISQVFAVYEGWKRTTTGVAQTQESGLLGAFAIEQDLRNAGFGMIRIGCTSMQNYHALAAKNRVLLPANPVTITREAQDSDRIDILYSISPFANVEVQLQSAIENSASKLYVNNDLGFVAGDLILVGAEGGACSILQFSGKNRKEEVPKLPNVTSSGNARLLPHDPSDKNPWNPPGGTNIFSGSKYDVGTRVLNLGRLVSRSFYVENNTLRMDELDFDQGTVASYDLVPGVMALRAECLPGACNEQPTAIRFGLIVRSGNREKDVLDQREVQVVGGKAAIVFWSGDDAPQYDLDEEARHYRYRVFTTIVPFKNVIWNPK